MNKKLEKMKEMGVNVEEAGEEKHENMHSQNLWVRKNDERPDFQNLFLSYLSLMKNYVSALTERACMDKSVYEKLISDLLRLRKEGYRVQRKNQFSYLDLSRGFIFIDPYETNFISDEDFITDVFTILFGSGLPAYYVEFECHSLITEELKSQLQDSERKCSFRLKEALIIHGGLSCDIVQQTVDECLAGIDKEPMVINEKDMPLSMQNFYDSVIVQQRLTMD